MAEAKLSIGEVAKSAGVNVSTIRFYEREGLLPEPERVGGRRRFEAVTIERLRAIVVAKRAGFSLDETRVLLTSIDEGAPAHEQLRALSGSKLLEVEALIERAKAMRAWLTLAGECECETLDRCALFSS